MPADPNQPSPSGVIDVPVSAPTGGSLTQQPSLAAHASSQSEPATISPGVAVAVAVAPTAPRPRRWLIAVGILATAGLCIFTIAVLYLQWWRTEPRNSLIVVWGQPSWEGATAEVTGPALPAGGLSHDLTKDEDLLARFHVPAGLYAVRVYRKDDRGRVTEILASRQREPTRPLPAGGIWWPFRAPPGVPELGLDR